MGFEEDLAPLKSCVAINNWLQPLCKYPSNIIFKQRTSINESSFSWHCLLEASSQGLQQKHVFKDRRSEAPNAHVEVLLIDMKSCHANTPQNRPTKINNGHTPGHHRKRLWFVEQIWVAGPLVWQHSTTYSTVLVCLLKPVRKEVDVTVGERKQT